MCGEEGFCTESALWGARGTPFAVVAAPFTPLATTAKPGTGEEGARRIGVEEEEEFVEFEEGVEEGATPFVAVIKGT